MEREVEMPALDLTFDEVATTTRSVRKRLDLTRPVEPEVLQECLAIAQQAPSSSNLQNFHFVIVTDAARRQALGDLYRRGYEIYKTLPIAVHNLEYADPAQKESRDRIIEAQEYLAEHIHEVPAHVIPCVEGSLEGMPPIFTPVLMASVIPAAWSFMLAARSRGLATCWSNLHMFDIEEANRVVGLPDGVMQVALIATAYSIGTEYKPAPRRALDGVVHWNTW
jgi:nitroreductase